jgi:hypothetical protein
MLDVPQDIHIGKGMVWDSISPLPTKTGDGIDLEDKEFLEFLAEFEDTGDFSLQ